jgi:CysZ protein
LPGKVISSNRKSEMNFFALTISSMKRARLTNIIVGCALLTFFSIALLVTGVTWLTSDLVNLETGWLDSLVNWLAGILTGIAGWFMLPSLMVLFAGIFQEQIIHRVEQVFYPDKVRARPPVFWPDVMHDVKFTLFALWLNIMVLPFYLFGAGFFMSILLNTYLLGREFFETVAGYHMGKPAARNLGRLHRKSVYAGGLVFTIMTLVPGLNLLTPVFATVWMVHLYHSITGFPKEENFR